VIKLRKTETAANFAQGHAVAEREEATGWGSSSDSASPLPLDQHHTRRSYMGYGELPQDARRELALPGDELARLVVNVSPAQIVHTAMTRPRGMPGKRVFADGTGPTGRIKAVHRQDYGLGPAYARPAAEGHDPGADQVDTDYLHQPSGPRPGVLDKYMGAAQLLPQPTGYGSGFPTEHAGSQLPVMGDELVTMASQAGRRARQQWQRRFPRAQHPGRAGLSG
jgi:hypothetical protein